MVFFIFYSRAVCDKYRDKYHKYKRLYGDAQLEAARQKSLAQQLASKLEVISTLTSHDFKQLAHQALEQERRKCDNAIKLANRLYVFVVIYHLLV